MSDFDPYRHSYDYKSAPSYKLRGERQATAARASVRALAESYSAEAIGIVAEVMRKGSNKERLIAAEIILDRGIGKPTVIQEVRAIHSVAADYDFSQLSDDELAQWHALASKAKPAMLDEAQATIGGSHVDGT